MPPFRNALFHLVVAVVFLAMTPLLSAGEIGWSLVNWKIRQEFPNVPRVDPAEVAAWIRDAEREKPVLLDVRTRAEFEVSHLPGAQRVEPNASPSAIDLPRDRPIVTYCSVGYRSGAFAEKLRQAGYTDVRNMSGSIFQWANEGRPLVREGKAVQKVHPYNKLWGMLLDESRRADVPSVEGK